MTAPPPYSPPRYDDLPVHYKEEEEEETWSMMMAQPWYKRWLFILGSWGPVCQQTQWIFLAVGLFILCLVVIGDKTHLFSQ